MSCARRHARVVHYRPKHLVYPVLGSIWQRDEFSGQGPVRVVVSDLSLPEYENVDHFFSCSRTSTSGDLSTESCMPATIEILSIAP